jgi:hypothetical protein
MQFKKEGLRLQQRRTWQQRCSLGKNKWGYNEKEQENKMHFRKEGMWSQW